MDLPDFAFTSAAENWFSIPLFLPSHTPIQVPATRNPKAVAAAAYFDQWRVQRGGGLASTAAPPSRARATELSVTELRPLPLLSKLATVSTPTPPCSASSISWSWSFANSGGCRIKRVEEE